MNFRRRLYIFIFIISIIFALILKSPTALMPMIFMFIATLVSYIYLFLIKNSCQVIVNQRPGRIYERKAKESYKIRVRNLGPLIFPKIEMDIELLDDKGAVVRSFMYEFMMMPREEKNFTSNISFPHIGRYRVKISRLQFFGIFDLMSQTIEPSWEDKVMVVARKYPIADMDISTIRPIHPVEYNVAEKIDGEVYDDIREYVPGDSIRNIHWKLSAHSGQLMTKILKKDAVSAVNVYMDFSQKDGLDLESSLDIRDSTIESAYALASYALENGRGVRLIYSGENGLEGKTPKDLEELDTSILDLGLEARHKTYPMESIMAESSRDLSRLDNIYLIISKASSGLLSILGQIYEDGYSPLVIYLGPEDGEDFKRLKESGVDYYIIESAKELNEKFGVDINGKDKQSS